MVKGQSGQKRLSKPVINIAVWGIAIGVLIMLMAVSITTGYQKEIKRKLTGFSGEIQISDDGIDASYESAPIPLDTTFTEKLRTNPKIDHFQYFANKAGIIKTQENMHGIILKGVDSAYDWKFFQEHLIEGRPIQFNDSSISQEALISEKIANILNLKIGDKFRVFFVIKRKYGQQETFMQKKYSFDVVGIYNTGLSEEFDKKFVFIDIQRIRKLNQWEENEVGGYEIFTKNSAFEEFYNSITQQPYERYYNKENYIKSEYYQHLSFLDVKSLYSRYQQILNWLDYINMHIVTILVIILVVAIVNMSSALLILILERTNMIGILKSLGARNFSIRKIFVLQASFLIGKGIIIGNVLALVVSLLQNYYGFIRLDPDTYYIAELPININFFQWLGINLLTIVCCSLMLLLPSLVITKISPIKAIRFD
jgi:lipoprotein-releasing system permease protein